MNRPLKLIVIGCGERARIYSTLAARQADKFQIVAGADPVVGRVERMRKISGNPDFMGFGSAKEILAEDKLADVAIIATQDSDHYESCRAALLKGYDVLLEKPAAQKVGEVLELNALAEKLNRRVMVCYVLRYTPFYRKVKEIIDSGILGDIISVNANEGVMPWHQAHSFVRGYWADTEKASPMIVAKCCHDMDILHWLIGRRCRKLSSFGALTYFRAENAPAGAPARCTDGCPHQAECMYNAQRYASDCREPWLAQIFDRYATASEEEVESWLKESPWGRCVYHCDNTAVDHQIVSMDFDDEITVTFTMTAFERGRHIEIYGTKAVLRAGEFYRGQSGADIHVIEHNGNQKSYTVEVADDEGNAFHGGGDAGLINNLYAEMTNSDPAAASASLQNALHGHVIAFAAEEARLAGSVIELDDFSRAVMQADA
jgi:predicted dehydrogenase